MTTSKTKTKPAAIAEVAIESDARYLAFDADGDWVLTFNCLQTEDQVLVGYTGVRIDEAKALPAEDRARVLAEEKVAGTGLVRCAGMRCYVVCGTLGAKIYQAVHSARVSNDSVNNTESHLERARKLVGAEIHGWPHQAFLVPPKRPSGAGTPSVSVSITTTPSGTKIANITPGGSHTCCRHCGKAPGESKRCGGCKNVYYCKRLCQAADWARHRDECQAAAAKGPAPEP